MEPGRVPGLTRGARRVDLAQIAAAKRCNDLDLKRNIA